MLKDEVRVVGFDADDTLWINETFYREAEERFADLLSDFGEHKMLVDKLFETEVGNLPLYGYGIKSFTLSMIETAMDIAGAQCDRSMVSSILALGKAMLEKPVELLPGVKEVLEALHGRFKLIVATKGDLLDQENKLKRSSVMNYFHHIEIMTDKQVINYHLLLNHLEIRPCEFVMIGNSLKSDILPPLELGCYAIHVPFHTTWLHEVVSEKPSAGERFMEASQITDILPLLL